jgi:hypothetical protein
MSELELERPAAGGVPSDGRQIPKIGLAEQTA